jgi:hypothetical protein
MKNKDFKRQTRRKILKPNPDYFPPDIQEMCPEGFLFIGETESTEE